jgi:hypothetical protein
LRIAGIILLLSREESPMLVFTERQCKSGRLRAKQGPEKRNRRLMAGGWIGLAKSWCNIIHARGKKAEPIT